MPKKDKRVDLYISKSQEFAKPILSHLRSLIHTVCPDVTETIKWVYPHFEHNGQLCYMAGFKKHCAFGFWKASLIKDPHKLMEKSDRTAMGNFGKLQLLTDLPKDKFLKFYLKEAMYLNEAGTPPPSRTTKPHRKKLKTPSFFLDALKKNKKAFKTFAEFSYTHQKEYVDWVSGAKTTPTQEKRLKAAIEWMVQGEPRNWKYIKPK